MSATSNFQIINKTKGRRPRLPFAQMKNAVLGKTYSLELAFVGKAESKDLNFHFRGKKKPANVLSFPLSKKEGQIVICQAEANQQSKEYGFSPRGFVGYLFIHGLLHLEGYRHGSKMEGKEQSLCKRFLLK